MSFMHKCWGALYKLTPAEYALEPAVASLGVRYRTQFPLWLWHNVSLPYFLDFALPDYQIAIEVDDPGHDDPKQMEKDRERTAKLREAGWVVVRCTNEDAVSNPVATVNRLMVQLGLPLRASPPDPETTSFVHDARRQWGAPVVHDRYGPGNGAARRRGRSSTSRASGARRGTTRS